MPSETMDSSSFFSKEISFGDERQLGYWKADGMDKFNGAKAGGSLLQQARNSLISNGFEHSNSDVSGDHRASSHLDMFGPSVGVNHHEEEESFESLKELEAKTIGDLLPDDDDELFHSVADKIDKNHLISSHWVLGLGSDGQALEPNCTTDGKYPSRSLLLQNIDSGIHDAELLTLFGRYGDVSTLYTKCKHQGFVMVSYYDIRAACSAMNDLQKLDIHFYNAKENHSENDVDQGIVVVYNVDSSVSYDELHQLFGVYGEVKEIREAPNRSQNKIIEFYDVRAADAALCALNRSEIAGNKIDLEPIHPGGARGISRGGMTPSSGNGTVLSARSSGRPPMSPCWENAFSGHNRSPSLLNLGLLNNQSNTMKRSNSNGQLNFNIWGAPDLVPDSQDSYAYGSVCKSPGNMAVGRVVRPSEIQENSFGRVSPREHPIEWNEKNVFSASPNGNGLSPGQNYMPSPQSRGNVWPNSPSFVNGAYSPRLQQMNNHLAGSPRSDSPSLWERRHGYAAEKPETPVFNSGSLGGLNIPGNSPHVMELIPHGMFACNGGSPMEIVHSPNVNQTFLVLPTRGPFSPVMSPYASPNERTRGRRSDASSSQSDNKQFELDIERITQGEDKRTTLMIKNIPNKYTSKMLLAALDEQHKGTYDFLYLPIDFKNKCNVGYAFINMTDPSLIVPLYQSLNGRKWEKFNSEKVASIAYARIQGKAALITHFQNSSLMNEDKRCRPMLFITDGPNAGDQVPFPMPTNSKSRGSRLNSPSSDGGCQETLPDPADEKENSCGNTFPETSFC